MADIVGRGAELEAVNQLLARARAGHSGVLVLRGEAGIGKTALLDHGLDAAVAAGFQVHSCVGVESESQFAFAGLHQLCLPLLEHLSALPDPQQAALGVAFGLREGPAPERFLVGLATLTLLAEVAERDPLLCLIDDAQWLDQASAQVLAFVARRVAAERLVLLFALRDPSEAHADTFAALPEARLVGLGEAEARHLLGAAVQAPLDDLVRDRIVAEARGNPLALLELPLSVQPGQLAGGYGVPDVPDIPGRIEDSFRARSVTLPAPTQLLLLVAAAEPTGEVALLWRAVGHLGIAPEAAAPAVAAGLLQVDTRVRFRHPLVRSAVYQACTALDRRRAHGALAEAIDADLDPDRRAWHRARAASGPDEEVAADLERSALRARGRGGLAAGAAFLRQAAELTPEPATRVRRAIAAAYALDEAGTSEAALELVALAEAGPLDAVQRARLDLLRAQISFHSTRKREVPRMLLEAAQGLAPLDAALSRQAYLRALDAAIVTGGVDEERGVLEVAEAARQAPPPPGPPGPLDLLLDGLVTTLTQGYAAGVPDLRRALEAIHAPGPGGGSEGQRWLWLASRTAMAVFDAELVHALASRNVGLARESGALATLPAALVSLSGTLVLFGQLTRAAELAAEQRAITDATGATPLRYADYILAAWRGRQDESADLDSAILTEATARRRGTEVSLARYAQAVLHNGLGDYAAAVEAADQAHRADQLLHGNLALPELIEAATHAGQPEIAQRALEDLSARAEVAATPFALGLAARSRALTSAGADAEDHYRESLAQFRRSPVAAYLARTHLVYGEWLRRAGRRRDAREQLRTAHDMLSEMGIEAFAGRAARELRATGEHPRQRTAQPVDALTTHELHIARLVATGATSREVGAQLFLSPRTIEAHLRNIFRKLGITSRRQLAQIDLPDREA